MAVRTACPHCRKPFSAPEEYLGRKIACPKCGHRLILRTSEEIREQERREEEALRRFEDDRRRIALIEREEERQRRQLESRPYYERFQTGPHPVRHHKPDASSRYPRLRVLSDVLTLGAYLVLLLALVGAVLTIYLYSVEILGSATVLFVCLVGWFLLGSAFYLLFKWLGEVAFLLADVGDEQNEIVQLLLDLRDNTDRLLSASAESKEEKPRVP